MRAKSLKKKLLFFLAFLVDQYSQLSIRNYYRYFYQPGGSDYKKESLQQILSRMNKIREIEKRFKRGEAYLRLGAKGGKFLDEYIPLWRFENKNWDKRWRLVIFDIEEKSKHIRDLLRKKIKELGFAKWQKSVYVTPHPVAEEINEYLKAKNLYPRCLCFEAEKLGFEDNKKLAYQIFGLGKLNKKYKELLSQLNNLDFDYKKSKLSKKEALKNLKQMVSSYENLLLSDPFLPKDLLPADWNKNKVKNKIKELLTSLN